MAISSTDASSITDATYGWISKAVHEVIEEKSYIHLTAEGRSIHTFLLCNFAEEPLQELMVCRDKSITKTEMVQILKKYCIFLCIIIVRKSVILESCINAKRP